jgi:hypothetical protein
VVIRELDANREDFSPIRVRDAANHALTKAKAPANLKVSSANLNHRGNIILLAKDDCKAEDILRHKDVVEEAIKKADPAAKRIQSGEHWTKIIVHSVDTTYFPDTPTGMEKLKAELETYNSIGELACRPRYLSRPERRQGKANTSVVISLENRHQGAANHILRRGIMAMGVHHKTEKFYSARPWDQCPKCQGFGHQWQRCQARIACRICAQNHETRYHECNMCATKGKTCPYSKLVCANCGGAHVASDPKCEAKEATGIKTPTQTQL